MAIAVSQLDIRLDTSPGATSEVSNSVAYTAGNVYLVAVTQIILSGVSPVVPTLSGWSTTWTQVKDRHYVTGAGTNRRVTCFTGTPSSSGTATLTYSYSTQPSDACITILEITGGSETVVQSVDVATANTFTSATLDEPITMATPGSTDNRFLAFVTMNVNNTNLRLELDADTNGEADWTSFTSAGSSSSPASRHAAGWLNADPNGDLTPGHISSTSAGEAYIVCFEIQAASTAVTPTDTANANTADAAVVTATTQVTPADTANANTTDATTITTTTAVTPTDTANANTADAAVVTATTQVTPADTANANTTDATTITTTTAVTPTDTANAHTSESPTVVDATPTPAPTPPTAVSVIESEWVQVDVGLDLLDEDGVFVMDISDDLQPAGSSVARVMGNRIHGTCDLVIARRLLWGSQRVRPKMILTDLNGGSMSWNLGVYALTTPQRVAGETPETYKVSGFDLLSFLDNPYGSTYSAAVGAVPLTLIATILTALGITNGIDQTAIGSTLATAYVRPLDQKNTTLLIVNELLAAVGYGPLWIDRDGRARSGPLTATTSSMWAYSADSATTTVGETRTQAADYWGVPNRWVFVRNGTTTVPTEGAGVYTVENVTDGETSQTGRGRVINRVEFLDAVDQAALEAQGDEIVAADRRVVSTISMAVAPNPEHWHDDRVTYVDAALGVSGGYRVVEWRLPFDGTDMSLELEAV